MQRWSTGRGLLLLLPLFLLFSCAKEEPSGPSTLVESDRGVFRADVDGGSSGFEIINNVAGDPRRPIEGPFLIRGTNLRYDGTDGALVADISVVNQGSRTHSGQVSLTFVSLLPEGIELKSSDNGRRGKGARVDFDFADQDGEWAPGESSESKEVRIAAPAGRSIAFVGRLDVGLVEGGGSIGGIVWNDLDQDGTMGTDEPGLGGAEILLYFDSAPDTTVDDSLTTLTLLEDDPISTAITDMDGTYRFDNLVAGSYSVVKAESERLRSTTEPTIQVLLVESEGEVSDFLMANFGCYLVLPERVIEIGDYVEATGRHAEEPDRLVARGIEWEACGEDEDDDPHASSDDDGDHEGDGDCGCRKSFGSLRGPVTDIDLDGEAVEIMGTWVHFAEAGMDTSGGGEDSMAVELASSEDGSWGRGYPGLELEDVEIGDRVWVRIDLEGSTDEWLMGYRLREWRGTPDKVHGFVQKVVRYADGRLLELEILGTMIEVKKGVEFEAED